MLLLGSATRRPHGGLDVADLDLNLARRYLLSMTEGLHTVLSDLESLKALLFHEPVVPTISVHPGQSLQSVIDQASSGSILQLEEGTYSGAIKIDKPLTILPRNSIAPGRVKPLDPPVKIVSTGDTVQITGHSVTVHGLSFHSLDPKSQIVTILGTNTKLDRCVVLGDPQKGQHRGICPHGIDSIIVGCYIDECWEIGRDAQGICGWNGTNGLKILDCYIGGGAQSIMFGGADSSSAIAIPRDILIEGCTLSKSPDWYAVKAQIKCALELKCAINVTVKNCIMEYAGISQGQGAYLIVLTPRNQSGKATWSTVQEVRIENCACRFGGGCVNFLGADDTYPSGPLAHITIKNVLFDAINPLGITKGAGRAFLFNHGGDDFTIDGVTINGENLASIGYFTNPPPTNLNIRNLKSSPSKYGWFVDKVGPGLDRVQVFAPDSIIYVHDTDPGATGYPSFSR
jgi:hypothetical protein